MLSQIAIQIRMPFIFDSYNEKKNNYSEPQNMWPSWLLEYSLSVFDF